MSALAAAQIAITASGRDKAGLEEADIVAVDLQGQALESAAPAPSAETPLHCALYRARAEVGAVAHTHSVPATVLAGASSR